MFERINLVPQRSLAGRIKRATPFVLGGLFCLSAGVVLVVVNYLDRQIKGVDQEIKSLQVMDDALKSQQAAAQQLAGQLKQLGEEERQLQESVAHLAMISEQKQPVSGLLDAIVLILPETVRCEKITLGGKGGQISGQATIYRDIPAFVQKLSEIPSLRNVSLSVLNLDQKKESDTLLSFSIVFELQNEKAVVSLKEQGQTQ
jgi:Tfp pilus assembly protein PilN